MKIDMFAAAEALSDRDLLAQIDCLVGRERSATAELLAHLAVLHARPSVYAAKGYGSIFNYCVEALKLSEDAACNRIEAAKVCGRFPVLFAHLASGAMTLSSIRLVGRLLTAENHAAVIERAKGLTLRETEMLIAELAPKPDMPSSMRKLPTPRTPSATSDAMPAAATVVPSEPNTSTASEPAAPTAPPPPVAASRSVVKPSAPERYRVQFTIGQETHDRLRRVQALLGREIPGGDPAAIFDRALKVLEAQLEKTKLAAVTRPRPKLPIRRETDNPASRHIPHEVKRAVWSRDGAQCAFVALDGRRCAERTYLEFHHVRPYARQGPATVGNISLRCRRHNQYEAEVFFGRQHGFLNGENSIRTPPPGC